MYVLVFLAPLLVIGVYFILSGKTVDGAFKLRLLLDFQQRQLIKKYFLPYKLISQQEKVISEQSEVIPQLEIEKKEEGSDILIKESFLKLSNNLTLKKYLLTSGFYAGIQNLFPGSGYISFHEENIIILSGRGLLAFRKTLTDDTENFRQIKNNINDFIGIEQFKKENQFSIKDLLIFNEHIYVSYTEEMKDNCWNTSVIYAAMSYENIEFSNFFSPNECIHSKDNIDNEFIANQSGGRLVALDKNNILLSVGDYRSRYLAQDIQSVNGKIIKLNSQSNKYELISMGHRNPQGLYFDIENNFILQTEHGPKGGDEINLIDVSILGKGKIQNYGWPISSAGEHYSKKTDSEAKYKKYPLHKSHSEYGFIEPLKSFVPSIGISEIVKITRNGYVASSLKDKSLYFFKLSDAREITNLERVEVYERIRDLQFKNNQLFLFLEDTPSIGVISLN